MGALTRKLASVITPLQEIKLIWKWAQPISYPTIHPHSRCSSSPSAILLKEIPQKSPPVSSLKKEQQRVTSSSSQRANTSVRQPLPSECFFSSFSPSVPSSRTPPRSTKTAAVALGHFF